MMVEKRQSSSRPCRGYGLQGAAPPQSPCLLGKALSSWKDRTGGATGSQGPRGPLVGVRPGPQARFSPLGSPVSLRPQLWALCYPGSKEDGSTTTFGLDGISDLPFWSFAGSQPENQR